MTLFNKKLTYWKTAPDILHQTYSNKRKSQQLTQIKEHIEWTTKKKQQQAISELEINQHQMRVLGEINLSGLTPKERTAVQHMLTEEADIFSVDNSDNENITSTSVDIKLSDNTTAQLKYHWVPRRFYTELKAHIEE